MSDIELITMDLDDTLWPCDSVIHTAEAALFEWLQREASRIASAHDVNSLRGHRKRLMQKRPDIAHDVTAIRLTSLQHLLEEFDYPTDLAQEAMAVFLEARNCIMPFPDVLPVLEYLVQHYCVVALTNGNADVRCTPLKECFNFSISAAQVGAAKPAPHLFYRALEQTRTTPEQAVHVGDDPQLDVMAAKRVGMHTVWVNRTGSSWSGALPPPEMIVTDFNELQLLL